MRELPIRKPNRLKGYDYSQGGAYFITICAKDRMELFSTIIGEASCQVYVELTKTGKIVDEAISRITEIYEYVSIEKYIIMPNHIHMIALISGNSGRQVAAPTVSQIIGNLKRAVSMCVESKKKKKSYYDHIIRNDSEYLNIAEYIESNPLLWNDDCFYPG
jgi:REP element-mobilizing transposase RayT